MANAQVSKLGSWLLGRMGRGIGVLAASAGLVIGGVWWLMMRMPGVSRSEPPSLSAHQRQVARQLESDIRHLADLGPRHYRRPEALHEAAHWLDIQLRAAGYTPERQTFEVLGVPCSNLIVERHGDARPEEILVVGAHYDTEPSTPGADDNASGVAGLLTLARRLADVPMARTLRLVAFVNEEMPHFTTETMGSLRAARRSRKLGEDIVGMISLESIGYFSTMPDSQKYPLPLSLVYPDTANFIGFVSNLDSRHLVRQAIGTFRNHAQLPSEGAVLPEFIPGVGWSDHSSYWRYGYPAIMVTDTAPFRNPNYHRAGDTPDTLDYLRMTHVVLGMEVVIRELVQ